MNKTEDKGTRGGKNFVSRLPLSLLQFIYYYYSVDGDKYNLMLKNVPLSFSLSLCVCFSVEIFALAFFLFIE